MQNIGLISNSTGIEDPFYINEVDQSAQPQSVTERDFLNLKAIISRTLIGVHNSCPVISRGESPTLRTMNGSDLVQVRQDPL